jgi:hypothetical protein
MEANQRKGFAVVLECSRKPKVEEMDVVDAVLCESAKSAGRIARSLQTD